MWANEESNYFTVNNPLVDPDTIEEQIFYLRPMFPENDPFVCIMSRIY